MREKYLARKAKENEGKEDKKEEEKPKAEARMSIGDEPVSSLVSKLQIREFHVKKLEL